MKRKYSRLSRTEERKNIRRAYLFGFLTLVLILVFIFLGLPTVAKFAAFLTDLRQSGEAPQVSDTTPPAPPRLEPIPESTNKFSVEIKGFTEPGVTVVLALNNKKEEVLTNKDGEFIYTFSLNDGENTITAVAVDSAGNESQKTQLHKVVYDNEPPTLELLKPEDGTEYYGAKQRQVIIEGVTEEGASVNINDRLVVVEPDGSFAFATTLSEGENQFSVRATDAAENETETSLTLQFAL